MRNLLGAFTIGLLAVLVLTTPVFAARTWCARDPIVRINGQDTQIWVAIPEEYESLVTGPIDVQVLTAVPVTGEVLFTDEGFNGYGETVTFGELKGGRVHRDGTIDTEFRVTVPIDATKAKSIPLRVTVSIGGDAVETAPGTWTYLGGTTYVIETVNVGRSLLVGLPSAPVAPGAPANPGNPAN